MANLKLWHDGTDWVVAETPEEANALRGSHYGEDIPPREAWDEWPKPTLKITPDEGSTWEEKPVAEWITQNGKGFLCSTEW